MNQTQLLKYLADEQQKWDLIVAAIGEQRMDQPGVNGDWTMRDNIAHLNVWQRRLVTRLQAAAARLPKPASPWPAEMTSEDEINAWSYATNRDLSVRQMLDAAAALQ